MRSCREGSTRCEGQGERVGSQGENTEGVLDCMGRSWSLVVVVELAFGGGGAGARNRW